MKQSICMFLEQKGFQVDACYDGEQAFDLMYRNSYNLVISDIMMPNVDGYRLVENIRQQDKDIPIILMTAKDDFLSKQRGFNSGVDDYLVKPVDLMELHLRVNAILRRANINASRRLEVGSFVMDTEEHMAYIHGEAVNFTAGEFNIVFKLLSYPKKTFSRSQLMNEFWNLDNYSSTRTVDVYIIKYVAFDRPIDLGELVCEVLLSFEHLWEEKDIDLQVIQIINDEMPAGIDGSFNLCDVRDLARGTSLAADKGQCGSCYILGNQEVSFKDFSPMVSQEAGCKKIKVFLPLKLATSSQVSWRTKLATLQEIDKKNATGRRFLLVYQWRLSV